MVLKWPQLYSLLNEWRNFDNVEGGDLLCNKQLVNFLVCVDPNILGPYQFIVQNLQSDSSERESARERECKRRESAREQERDGGEKERGRWRDIEGEFSERERE